VLLSLGTGDIPLQSPLQQVRQEFQAAEIELQMQTHSRNVDEELRRDFRRCRGWYRRVQPHLETAFDLVDTCPQTMEALADAAKTVLGQIEEIGRTLAENHANKHPASL
jgi:hypothetical protein